MSVYSSKIDVYIENAQEFAKPILTQLRAWIHETCPIVEETIKWSFPNFLYKGKILCSMASFKQHCSFGFWLGSMMNTVEQKEEGMGQFGKLTTIHDLPDFILFKAMIHEAMGLIDAGKTVPKSVKPKKELIESPELITALEKNPVAQQNYHSFSTSHKREYNDWIMDAKTEQTKQKRIEQTIDLLTEGKSRNWKYEK